jgi:hypothetical protein
MINLNNASLLASTIPLNLNATDFFAQQYAFSGEGGFLTNDGKIVGNNADLVALIANAIENSGTIEVPMGTVALAAGNTVTVGISPDGMVSIGVDPATVNKLGLESQIKNTGTITADGGRVVLNAQAMDGLFEKAISLEKNGTAVSAVSATNGTIEFQSMDDIYNNAVVEASGGVAKIVSTQGSVTNAGAIQADRGKVEVIAEKGSITNEGTMKADHGIVKLTAEQAAYNKMLLEAIHGKIDITVKDDGGRMAEGEKASDSGEPLLTPSSILHPSSGSIVNEGTMDASHGKIELNAAGAVETKGVLKADEVAERGASFKMGGRIEVGSMDMDNLDHRADIVDGAELSGIFSDEDDISVLGDFSLIGDTTIWTDSDGLNDDGTLTWAAAYLLTGNGYDLTLKVSKNSTVGAISGVNLLTLDKNTGKTPTYTGSTSDDINVNTIKTEYGTVFSKDVTVGSDHMIYSASDAPGGLQYMDQNLGYNYKLANNVDASETSSWNAGDGFDPVGRFTGYIDGNNPATAPTTPFTGVFDGQDHAIMGLTINRPSTNGVGLFGSTTGATIQNVGLLGGSTIGSSDVGNLVGVNWASTISNSYATGNVSGAVEGGLVGVSYSASVISNCYATGNVNAIPGGWFNGGLVGVIDGSTVQNCYATGNVTGNSNTAGLVGRANPGSVVTNSYATGNSSGFWGVGGLVGGYYNATISKSYATGSATGSNYVGGLVGHTGTGGIVSDSFATGIASGSNAGGLVGGSLDSPTYSNNWWFNSTNTGDTGTSGNLADTLIGKAAAATDFNGTGGGTGGAVYSGWTFGDGNGGWVSFAGGLPHLDWEWSSNITTLKQLQNMNLNLSASYTLVNDIDASSTAYWNGGAGFDPVGGDGIGHSGTPFTGDFDGNSKTITGLTIDRPAESDVGLFGFASGATIHDVGLVDADVSGYHYVGILAGIHGGITGMISNAYATGFVSSSLGNSVGGLVGTTRASEPSCYGIGGTIQDSYANVIVTGANGASGGLLGDNWGGKVIRSYAIGDVSGVGGVGGLVGGNEEGAIILDSYATGNVTSSIDHWESGTGGLVGVNQGGGVITNSYATGDVSAPSNVGGLVGNNKDWYGIGTVINSFATGNVTGNATTGGLIGSSDGSGVFTNNWWSNNATLGVGSGEPGAGKVDKASAATDFFDTIVSGPTDGSAVYDQGGLTPWDFDYDGSSAGATGNWIMAGLPHLQNEWTTNITNAAQLQMMALNLSANYTLANDIDASATSTWNGGKGFDPVGGSPSSSDPQPLSPYSGTFDGQGHTITGLTITRHTASAATTDLDSTWVGLFGAASGTVKNVGMLDVNIWGNLFVGGLVGELTPTGTVMNSYTTGAMRSTYDQVGGLVGQSHGTITDTYSTANIQGDYWWAGGLVGAGQDASVISNSYATGNVSVAGAGAGGLVGVPSGTISHSFATGTVSGGSAGGLVSGYGTVTIDHSYFTGPNNGRGTYEPAGASAFNGSSHPVYSGWDPAIWQSNAGALPELKTFAAPFTGYTIAGLISGLGEGISIALSLNGAAPVTTTTTSGGAFSFGSLSLSGGEYMLIYANDGSYKANLVGMVQSAGDISGLQLQDGRFAMGDADGVAGTSFANTDLASAYYNNSNVHYSMSGSDVTFLNGIDLWIPANVTYTPGGNITATGSWINQGVFNAGNFSVNLQGTGTHTILSNGSHFNDLTVASGNYGLQDALHVDGDVTIVDGFTGGPAGYDFRKTITIDHTQVAADLEGFPVLLNVTDPSLIGKVKSGSNYTLKFTNAVGAELPYEVESYDDGTGALTVWVKLDSISSGEDTSFHIYYGTDATEATDNPTAVWDANYMGVWHMNTSGSTLLDSKGTYNGSIVGTPDAAAGAVGGALTFVGNQEYVDVPNTVSTDGSFTVQCWVNLPSAPTQYMEPVRKGNYASYRLITDTDGDVGTGYAGPGGPWYTADTAGGGYYSIGSWQQMTGVYDAAGQTLKMYLNGQLVATGAAPNAPAHWDDGEPLNIGSWYGTRVWTYEPFVGTIDEVRFSDTNRSDAWIATEFNNQSAPSAFLSVGDQAGGGATLDTNGFSVDIAGTLLNQGVLTATAADLNVAAKAIDSTGTISTTTSGNINLDSTVVSPGVFDLGAINSAGIINIGTTNAPSAIVLNNDITSHGNAAFNAPVVLGADVSIDTSAGNGNLTFGSTLNSDSISTPRNLTLDAGTGEILFSGDVGMAADYGVYSDAVSYWDFDGGTVDDLIGANDGTAVTAAWTADGKIGGAYVFDGTSERYIQTSDNDMPAGDSSRTVSLWFKLNDSYSHPYLASWGTSSYNQGSTLCLDARVGRYALSFTQDGAINNGAAHVQDMGVWYHGVLVYTTGGSTEFYVNGVNSGLQNQEFGTIDTVLNGTFELGNKYASSGYSFNGVIDETAVWNRALSPAEVASLYNGGNGLGTSLSFGAITINSASDVTFNSDVNAASITQAAGTGTTAFNGAVDLSGAMNITNAATVLNGAATIGGDFNLNAGAVTQNADLNITGDFNQTGGTFTDADPTAHAFSVGNSFSIPETAGAFNRYGDQVSGAYQIRDVYDLQAMKGFLNSNFTLAGNIDAADTTDWNSGEGFDPVGSHVGGIWESPTNPFTGVFEGNHHEISGLYIHNASRNYAIGLFGATGQGSSISNIGLVNANVSTANSGANYVAPLVGQNYYGTITNAYASGTVTGGRYCAAGLVGWSDHGDIANSHSTVTVNAGWDNNNGGLVGLNSYGTIRNSYATGDVIASANLNGGLVGIHEGSGASIIDSYATGSVTGSSEVGGLVGGMFNGASITNSYSTGGASGSQNVGGLVGYNQSSTIDSSYATGDVSGDTNFGGLVGFNTASGITGITDSYSHKIYSVLDLQLMQNDLDGSFTLMNDIDASDTVNWNSGLGFDPIGDGDPWVGGVYFTGAFDGQGKAIQNLIVDRPSEKCSGLFGSISDADIHDIHLENVSISGGGDRGFIAGLAGLATGSSVISNASVSGTVTGYGTYGVGGLVGMMYNGATVYDSYASVDVVHSGSGPGGNVYIGGLVGQGWVGGGIYRSYATGTVTGGVAYNVGGLAGHVSHGFSVSDSHATGNVSGAYNIGGLIGSINGGILDNSYATGDVSGASSIGGLVGSSTESGITGITGSYSHKIYNVLDLQLMQNDLNADFTLMNDIDASATSSWNSGAGFDPVGDGADMFYGNFIGNHHTISNLYINRPTENYVGLFGATNGDKDISNVGFIGGSITGQDAVGFLAGQANYDGKLVSNAYSTGGTVSGRDNVGGLIGWVYHVDLENCYSTNAVSGRFQVGGLAGGSDGWGRHIYNSYATGNVTGTGNRVGGLVGNIWYHITVDNSYATGNVIGADEVGGFAGMLAGGSSASHSYSTGHVTATGGNVGGFSGLMNNQYGAGSVSNSYYNSETSGMSNDDGRGTPKTTAEMMQQATFSGWDFTSSWKIYDGYTTPLLKSFLTPLTVTANAVSKIYDGTTNVTGNGVNYSAVPNSELKGTLGYIGATKNVGTYAGGVTPTGLYSTQQGYDITLVGGDLTVTPYGVTVTADAGQSKVYGAADPTLTYQSTGLFAGDAFSGALIRAAGETVAGGPYAITQGTLDAGTNYTLTFVGNNFSITPKALTVTADAGQAKVYGAADPTLTYQSSGLVGADSLTGSLGRGAGETVAGGPYAITQGTLNAGSNYSITFIGDTFSITPKALTVTADAGQSKVYGAADPTLTYQSSGLVGTDSLTGSLGRAAGETVAGGPYAITQGTLDAGSNYALTFVGNNFSITPYGVTVVANAGQSKVYGSVDPTLTYQSTGLLGADTFSGVLARAAGETVAGGPYAIGQGTLDAGSNYSITFVASNFSITPYGVTVTADAGQSKVYGSVDPTLTYQSTGLLGGDTFSGVLARAAGETVLGGPYAITQGTLDAGSNYSITFTNNTFSITPRPLTLDAAGVSKVYDGTNAATVTFSDDRLDGDVLSASYSAAFADRFVGAGKAVSVTGLSISGADAANYALTSTTDTTSANITALVSGSLSGAGAVPLALALNGVEVATTTADAQGAFTFGGNLYVASGDALLVYVTDGSHRANLVGTVSAPESVTNLTLANGQVSIGSANAVNLASSYTNSDFMRAKESLTNNIYYSVANNALTVTGADLYIPANVTFAQSGAVAVTGNFAVAAGGTFRDSDPLSHSFTVSGNFSVPYSTSGSFKRYTGAGDQNDPYIIRDIYDLQAMNSNLSSNFRLNDMLDLSATANWNGGAGFNPIGTEGNPFSGTLHGNGNILKDLTMHRNGNYSGFFGYISGNVDNLGLEDASVYGADYTGALAGFSSGTLTNVYTTGAHTVSGVNFVGGLVGGNTGSIANAYSSARVMGTDNVGGLVGAQSNTGTINNTYAMGYVTGTSHTGGLVGANTSTAPSSVSNSFWDKKMTGQNTSAGGTAGKAVLMVPDAQGYPVEDPETILDTASPDMMSQATYSGWDFANTWVMDEGGTYPHFQFRYPNGVRGVGGHVYVTQTTDNVTTTSAAGPGQTVAFYYSNAAEGSPEVSLEQSVGTGASSRFYGVIDRNAVAGTDYVIGKNLDGNQAVTGSSKMQAGSGSIYPLDVWSNFYNRAAQRPVLPALIVTPPAEVISEEAVSRTLVDSVVIPIVTPSIITTPPVPVVIVDQTGSQGQNLNFNDLIGGISQTPLTPSVTVPIEVPAVVSVTPPSQPQTVVTPARTTESEPGSISFSTEPPPGREPVPVTDGGVASSAAGSSGAASNSSSANAQSSGGTTNASEATSSSEGQNAEGQSSESEGEVKVETEAEESETAVENEETAATNEDAKPANWRDVPITGFDGKDDPRKFLTDVRVVEGAVYVIDGANAMSLLGMGDSMRIFYKKRKPAARKLQPLPKKQEETSPHLVGGVASTPAGENSAEKALDKVLNTVAQEPEVAPAPEQQVRKSAAPVVMRQTASGDRYGTLKNPGKDVFVKSQGGDWMPAKDGMVILPGDQVKTADSSSVEVMMDGGNTGKVEIKEGSLFRILQAESDPSTGDKRTVLDLALGKILVKVESLKGNSKFEVRTPTALTGVRGTIFEVTVKEKV